jgi:hypothetical protein
LSTDLCLTDSAYSNSKIQSFEQSVKFRVSVDVSGSSQKPTTPQYPERIYTSYDTDFMRFRNVSRVILKSRRPANSLKPRTAALTGS